MTIVMGAGVAIMHASLPPAVRAWLPHRIGFATARLHQRAAGRRNPARRADLSAGAAAGRRSWRGSFAFWSVPVAVIALVVLVLAPRAAATRRRRAPALVAGLERSADLAARHHARHRQRDVFRQQRLPARLSRSTAWATGSAPALTALNVGQLPASFLLLAFAGRLERKAWPYVVCGVLCARRDRRHRVRLRHRGSSPAPRCMGFSAAGILILVLALPPLLAAPDDVHRVSAAMFTISYSCAVIVPVISGLALGPERHSGAGLFAARALRHRAGRAGAGDQPRAARGDLSMRPIPVGAKGPIRCG